jgi:hypothetical protein
MVILNRKTKGNKMSTNRAVLLTEKEISLLYFALSELRVFSDNEAKDQAKLMTKLFETVCIPATA